MRKRKFSFILAALCLIAVLAGCGQSGANSEAPPASFDIQGEFDNSMIIIGGEGGIIGQYPEDNWEEVEDPEQTEPTEPPQVLFELPDGTQVPEENVQTLDDGTIVAFTDVPTGHKCFFTDGTYAITRYSDASGTICTYDQAAGIYAQWYLQNGSPWKNISYTINADGSLFLENSKEFEYTPLEIGTEDSPWYHSATTETWYEEEAGEYRTARAEYDSLHGSEKPIKWTYYDGSYSEHEYNLDGTQKKSTYYSPSGVVTQADFYENDQMITQYLFREDGSRQFVTHYKDGEITSESYYAEGGFYNDTTYYKNGYRSYCLGQYDDGRTSSTYYDEKGAAIKFLSNAADGSLEWYALYENYPDGNLKKATYYSPDGQITKVEEYDADGNMIE